MRFFAAPLITCARGADLKERVRVRSLDRGRGACGRAGDAGGPISTSATSRRRRRDRRGADSRSTPPSQCGLGDPDPAPDCGETIRSIVFYFSFICHAVRACTGCRSAWVRRPDPSWRRWSGSASSAAYRTSVLTERYRYSLLLRWVAPFDYAAMLWRSCSLFGSSEIPTLRLSWLRHRTRAACRDLARTPLGV